MFFILSSTTTWWPDLNAINAIYFILISSDPLYIISIFTSIFIYINTQFQHFIVYSHPVFLHLVPSGTLSRILILILHVSHLAHPTVTIYKKTLLICYSIFFELHCTAFIYKQRNVCFLPNTHEKITTTSDKQIRPIWLVPQSLQTP